MRWRNTKEIWTSMNNVNFLKTLILVQHWKPVLRVFVILLNEYSRDTIVVILRHLYCEQLQRDDCKYLKIIRPRNTHRLYNSEDDFCWCEPPYMSLLSASCPGVSTVKISYMIINWSKISQRPIIDFWETLQPSNACL